MVPIWHGSWGSQGTTASSCLIGLIHDFPRHHEIHERTPSTPCSCSPTGACQAHPRARRAGPSACACAARRRWWCGPPRVALALSTTPSCSAYLAMGRLDRYCAQAQSLSRGFSSEGGETKGLPVVVAGECMCESQAWCHGRSQRSSPLRLRLQVLHKRGDLLSCACCSSEFTTFNSPEK